MRIKGSSNQPHKSYRRWHCASAALLLVMASPAIANDRSNYPTFMFDLNYGLTTSKSKLVGSNDTGTSLGYGLSGFAGASKNIEYAVGFETDSTTFQLNQSKIAYDWQDTKLRYHLGSFYAGLVFSRLNLAITNAAVETIDAAGSGYGGSLGYMTGIGKRGMFRFDVTQVSIAKMKNALVSEVSVPSRMDIDIGASIDLWGKWSNFNFGYRMRTLSLKTDAAYADTGSSTYVGFKIMTGR